MDTYDRGRPSDDDRTANVDAEEPPLLPEQTRDDTEGGWGVLAASNDERLRENRPPHWD